MKLRDFFLALSAGALWLMLASHAELNIEAGRDIFSQINRLRHAGVKVKTASSATTKVRTCARHEYELLSNLVHSSQAASLPG